MGKIRNPVYAILEPNTQQFEPINFGDIWKVFTFHELPEGTTLPLAVYEVLADFGPVEDYLASVLEGMVLEVGIGEKDYLCGTPVKWLTATYLGNRQVSITNLQGEEVTQ